MFGRSKTAVPEWASLLKPKYYDQFMNAIHAYFTSKGDAYTIEEGIVRIEESDQEFGLNNLVQMCAQAGPQEYPGIIEYHFNLMIEAKAFMEGLDTENFEEMRQYLGVRLYDSEYLSYMEELTPLCRQLAGEVSAVLVYDFPHSIETLPASMIDTWGVSEDELFAIGIDNIKQAYEWGVQEVEFGDDKVLVLETEHFYAPNIMLDLEGTKGFIGMYGTIIGIPTRSLAMIYPINNTNLFNSLNLFFANVPTFYQQGPGSLTQEVYWYHDGQFEVLNYWMDDHPNFSPSDEFLAMMEDMAQQFDG